MSLKLVGVVNAFSCGWCLAHAHGNPLPIAIAILNGIVAVIFVVCGEDKS
jgi:hypothetical protein